MQLPQAYLDIVLPLIDKARGFLENGESLEPFAFVGNHATRQITAILIDTRSDESKDQSAEHIRFAAAQTEADFVFTIMEAWACPRTKCRATRKSSTSMIRSAPVLTRSTSSDSCWKPTMACGAAR